MQRKHHKFLNKIKKNGFHYSTKAAISIAISDIVVPDSKKELLAAAEEKFKRQRNSIEEVLFLMTKGIRE